MAKYQKLLDLIQKNPELEVIPMVDYEVCYEDSCCRWAGSFGSCSMKEYTLFEMYYEQPAIKYKEDEEEIKRYIYENNEEARAEEIINSLEWKKAIFVNIDLPEF